MKIFITILVLAVVLVGGYFLFRRGGEPVVSQTPTATVGSATISYTTTGYSPKELTVKAGATVTFRNDSTVNMWPASAMHPTHNGYPEQGSCFAGKFENCTIAPGGTYVLQFNVIGTWGFHDHLDPSKFGKIIVTN